MTNDSWGRKNEEWELGPGLRSYRYGRLYGYSSRDTRLLHGYSRDTPWGDTLQDLSEECQDVAEGKVSPEG